MWIRLLVLIIIGIGGGAVTAAGYFAVLVSVGVVTRFADYTNTASKIRLYEIVLCMGGIFGNLLFVFRPDINVPGGVLGFTGLAFGIFIGCFLLSLAEAVKGLPVFLRRSRIQKGISLLIICLALGKSFGSIFYLYCYFLKN